MSGRDVGWDERTLTRAVEAKNRLKVGQAFKAIPCQHANT